MATRRIEVQRYVKFLRKKAHNGCKECGRFPPQGVMLGDPEKTFSEMVIEPGMTMDLIDVAIAEKGLVCRRCWNYSTRVKPVGLSSRTEGPNRSSEELMRDPKIREQMEEKKIKVPQSALDRGVPQIEGL